jgi:hypothetical protein
VVERELTSLALGWGRPTPDTLRGLAPVQAQAQFGWLVGKEGVKQKRGTYTAITLRSTRRTQIKKTRDKQFFGLTKFPAATHVSDVFLP